MLRVTLGQWRRQQRRETLAARQAAQAAQAAAAETSAAVADSAARAEARRSPGAGRADARRQPPPRAAPDQLSPAQRLEVERLVSQRVDEELRWLRANLPELVAAAVWPAGSAGPCDARDCRCSGRRPEIADRLAQPSVATVLASRLRSRCCCFCLLNRFIPSSSCHESYLTLLAVAGGWRPAAPPPRRTATPCPATRPSPK